MSQIELTLTAEHWNIINKQFQDYCIDDDFDDDSDWNCRIDDYRAVNPLTLTFELPSPWNYDISKAPKDGTQINIIDTSGNYQSAIWICYNSNGGYWCCWRGFLNDDEITAWMEIPALPERK